MKRILIIVVFLNFITSCRSQKSNLERLEVASFKEHIEQNNIQLIDVRTSKEFKEGAIQNATVISFYEDDFKEEVLKLDKENPVYLYCKGGNRSKKALKILTDLGFKKIYDLKGGYMAWENHIAN